MMALLVILLFLIGAATFWHFNVNVRARDAALRVETAKAVQSQRAKYDAQCVAQSAAQDVVPKRKHRKKT
jgi:hypothetical protein